MKRRLAPWVVHCIYLLLIAVLAGTIVRKHLLDGEVVLSASLATTLPIAQKQIRITNRFLLQEMKRRVETYVYEEALISYKEALKFNKDCEQLSLHAKSKTIPPKLLKDNIPLLLRVPNLSEGMNSRVWQEQLLQDATDLWLKRLNRMRPAQAQLLAPVLSTNLLLLANNRLNYSYGRFTGLDFNYEMYEPCQISSILCPAAGQTFTSTVFLSAYNPSSYLYEESDRIWVNEKQLSINSYGARFSTVFTQPGLQPLHIRIEKRDVLTDSVRVYEKTYLVQVR